MKMAFTLLFLITGLILSGCSKTPNCSDPETINLVKKIFDKSIRDSIDEDNATASQIAQQLSSSNGKFQGFSFLGQLADKVSSSIQVTVDTIRVASQDEKIGKYSCDAELVIKLPPNLQQTEEDIKNQKPDVIADLVESRMFGFKWIEKLNNIDKLNGDTISQDIHYTSQLTEDKKQQLVELQGSGRVAEMVASLGAIDSMNGKSNQSKTTTNISPAESVQERSSSEANILNKYTASFDCNKAVTTAEKITCSSTKLGQLDGLLAATYKERISDPDFGVDKPIFKKQQLEWQKTKDMCGDAACVEKAYRNRIGELCEMPVVSGVHPNDDCDSIQN